jgi:CIC family chloride channel protein
LAEVEAKTERTVIEDETSRPGRSRIARWFDRLRQSDTQMSLLLSVVIGALVGLIVVAFILLTGRLAAHMYPPGGSGWRRILVPTLGSLLAGYFLYKYFPLARGSGIPQTKAALFLSDGVIQLKTAVGKFFCCALSLASGIALGREGPCVHVGAGVASVIGRHLGLSKNQVKALVPMGCSAALAAAFNTPIAAVIFSLEEILGDLHAPVLGSVVLSSATSWMVLHLVLGDEPLFHVPAYHLVHPVEFGVYAVLGVVGGFGSVSFVKLLLWIRERFQRLPSSTTWFHPALGGLGVGLMGFFVPEVLGVGYDYVERVLNGDVVLGAVLLLVVSKIVGTALCYGSGNAGGIFGPSLFMGAMMGASVGSIAHLLFPALTADPGAYALVGMGTAFAGIIRTPWTSVIMIFELTRDYTIIVPLMISNLIAFFISYKLQREPIYEALSHQDGIHLPVPDHHAAQGRHSVADAMHPTPQVFSVGMPLREAASRARSGGLDAWPVVENGYLVGIVKSAVLEDALASGSADQDGADIGPLIRRVADAPDFPHVHPDHSLSVALERMGSSGDRVLPVVSRADVHRLLGIVKLEDVLESLGVAHHDSVEGAHESKR